MTMTRTEFTQVRDMSPVEALPPVVKRVGAAATKGYDPTDTSWMAKGGCRDESGQIVKDFLGSEDKNINNEMNEAAKKVCKTCVVIHPCREYALANPSIKGVLGGMTYTERVRVRKARRLAAAV